MFERMNFVAHCYSDWLKPMRVFTPRHLCWRPGVPDFRDLVPESPEILRLMPDGKLPEHALPVAADLSEYLLSYSTNSSEEACPSSVVCTKLVEYFFYRCLGKVEPLSAQFVTHSATMYERSGCPGIRSNLKAIRKFGIPPTSIEEPLFRSPDSMMFGITDELRAMSYFRIGSQTCGESTTRELKSWIARGFPIACGFAVPSLLEYDGDIDYRPTFDSIQGGHAALLIGFDDKYLAASRGAFRVFCPWGNDWGDQGSGWLPYSFAEHHMALDFWTILNREWIASGELFNGRNSNS